jgi:predicted nucleic acid-binding protein
MQYVDSSALVKRYVREEDSDAAQRLLAADDGWVTAGHTLVEVRRALSLRLADAPRLLADARESFQADWAVLNVVAVDEETCGRAAGIAEATGARSLDALHLAAAHRAGAPALRVLTFDARMAQTARALGWTVAGA